MADNNIALGVKQPEPVNYLGQMAQVMAIKVAQQEMQGNDQMRAAYGDGSGDWSDPAFRQKMYTANPTKAAAMEEKAAKTKQDQLAGAKAQLGLRGQLAGGLIADPTFDNFQRVLAQGVQYGLGSQKDAEAELLRIGNDPAKIKKWAEDHQRGALDAEKQLPKLETKDFGGTVGVLSIDPVTGQAKQTYTQNKTQSPDSAASVGATIRGQNMTDALGRERLNAETAPLNLSPEALDAAAAVFNATGRLPPVGVGKRAAQSKVDIMTRAGQLAGGPTNNINPTEAPPNVNNLNSAAPPVAAPGGAPVVVASPVAAPTKTGAQIGAEMIQNKQDNATQGAALKNFATGTQGNRVTFLNTAVAHGDTLAPLVDALDNGDMTAINAAKNFYKKQMGKEAPLNFDAVKRIYGEEITKAIVANGGTGDERKEAGKMLDAANSPAQLKGVIDKYQELLGGQLEGLRTQYKSSTGRDDFDTKLHERTKEVLVRKRGGGGGGATPKTAVSESEKSAALKWAEANPGDTRAAQIRSALGAQ